MIYIVKQTIIKYFKQIDAAIYSNEINFYDMLYINDRTLCMSKSWMGLCIQMTSRSVIESYFFNDNCIDAIRESVHQRSVSLNSEQQQYDTVRQTYYPNLHNANISQTWKYMK